MSANKDFDKKKFFDKDENTDSGVISGPISEELDTPVERESVIKKVTESDTKQVTSDIDSGLDLSERLSSVKLSEYSTPTPVRPVPTITFHEPLQDIPPIELLFRQDDDGDTQLHIAAVHGCEKSVSTLIRVCPDRTWLDIQNFYGHTALHLAVLCRNAVVTRMLIIAGASVGVRDLAGQTPLHIATAEHQLQCLQALLAPIAENVPRKMASILNRKDYRGQTCVHIAAAQGHTDTLQTLVYYGADVNAREGLAGWTALHAAARRGDARVCAYLVGRCAGVALDARDYAGRTPRRLLPRELRNHPDFDALPHDDEDDDTDSEDEYDSDSESLFERLRDSFKSINVA